jgi:hypothetical protein
MSDASDLDIRNSDRVYFTVFVCCLAVLVPAFARARPSRPAADPIQVVRSVMSTPDDKIDFARAKLTFDKLYDPASTDIDATLKQIDDTVQIVRAMAGPSATAQQRLIALRTYIYKAGPWNGNNPFTYDFADPLGRKTSNQLLATYQRRAGSRHHRRRRRRPCAALVHLLRQGHARADGELSR